MQLGHPTFGFGLFSAGRHRLFIAGYLRIYSRDTNQHGDANHRGYAIPALAIVRRKASGH